jgi:hypothetical protein
VECDGLQVDTLVLHAAGAALRAVRDEVRAADGVADVGPGVLGHDGVRERVLHLATGWASGRAALATEIDWLGHLAEQAGAEFERIEHSLVAGLAAGLGEAA